MWRRIAALGAALAIALTTVPQAMAADDPKRYVATMTKSIRKGKIFIDYLRNSLEQTAVAAYSTRARPGAPVSVPLAWDELSIDLRSDSFTLVNLPDRLRRLSKDPWAEYGATNQRRTKTMRLRLT